MNESERSVVRKKFEEKQHEFETWKQKVEKDGRAQLIKNLKIVLSKRFNIYYHICSNIIHTVKLILNFCTIEII